MAAPAHIVAPEQIQAELSRIWESLQGTNKMRACLFNLIIYTQRNERAEYIRDIAQKVIEKFPSRIILVTVDKNAGEDYLKTAVSVMTAPTGQYDIACDLIEIAVAGDHQQRIPFMILPHILPDLPTYLVWGEDPNKENPLSYQLEKFANRLIFDSESTDNLPLFAASLLHHKEVSKCDIADLNWARIESWRDVIATTFAHEERLENLKQIRSIHIQYNTHETAFFCHTKIQGTYLQGWLASRLGWQFQQIQLEKEAVNFFYSHGDKSIAVSLTPVDHPELAPGVLLSVEINTYQDDHYSFVRNPQFPHQIGVIVSTPEECEMPCQYTFAKIGSGQSLVKEICRKGTSDHYIGMLELLSKMDALSIC